MKILLSIIATLILTCNAAIQAKEKFNLNSEWKFSNSTQSGNIFEAVVIPHVWIGSNITSGQYTRVLNAPLKWQNKKVFLKFNSVSSSANLLINGRYVGEHKGSFTAFTFDITPFIICGASNTIQLYVNNTKNFDVLPLDSYYYNYGGVTRDIELIIANPDHISLENFGSDGINIRPKRVSEDIAEIDVDVAIAGRAGDSIRVTSRILKNDIVVVQKSVIEKIDFDGHKIVTIPQVINRPSLWQGKIDPQQYEVEVTLHNMDYQIQDRQRDKFGLRTFGISPSGTFMLNAKEYPLYGVMLTSDRFGSGSGLTKYEIEAEMKDILDLGVTAVRTSPGPLDPYFYELCDKYGIIVWCDFPFIGNPDSFGKDFVNSYLFISNSEKQMNEMLYQYNNHPSIAMWGIYNKVSTKGDSPVSFIDKLNSMAKSFSPDRYTVATSVENGNINYITDLIGWGQYFGWANGGLGDFGIWLRGFNNNWLDLKPSVSDFGAEAKTQHSEYDVKKYKKNATHISETGQNIFHEAHIKEINVAYRFWGYFINSLYDFRSSTKDKAGEDVYTHYGLITYDRSTKKDAYYLYKANWNKDDKFVYITGKRANHKTNNNNITVYSNCESVELFSNGTSMGVVRTTNGIAKWSNIRIINNKSNLIAIGDRKYRDEMKMIKTDEF